MTTLSADASARESAFIARLGRLLFLHDWSCRHPAAEVFDPEGLAEWLKDAGCSGDNLDPAAYLLAVGDTQVRELGYLRPLGKKKAPRGSGHPFTAAAQRMLHQIEGANARTLENIAGCPIFRRHVRGLAVSDPSKQGIALANYVFPRAVGEQPSLLVPAVAT